MHLMCSIFSCSFVDVDVDFILFPDVDLDDDEPVEVVGKSARYRCQGYNA